MPIKTEFRSRLAFSDPEAWITYVRDHVAVENRHFVRTFGSTELLLQFIELRGMRLPGAVIPEIECICALTEPARTSQLESVNSRLLAVLTQELSIECEPNNPRGKADHAIDPQLEVETLIRHLARTSYFFALWLGHTKQRSETDEKMFWREAVAVELGTGASRSMECETEYALLMGELGELLLHYRRHRLPLPSFSSERVQLLHLLHGTERNLQARAFIGQLTEAIGPCGCA